MYICNCIVHVSHNFVFAITVNCLYSCFFLFPRLEHPSGWICARYKSLLLLLLLLFKATALRAQPEPFTATSAPEPTQPSAPDDRDKQPLCCFRTGGCRSSHRRRCHQRRLSDGGRTTDRHVLRRFEPHRPGWPNTWISSYTPKQPGPSTKKRASFQEQLDQYRTKHRELNAAKTKPPVSKKMQSPTPQPIINADILIIGDPMIKRLQPRRLSRQTKVICHTMRVAKIEDAAPNAKHLSTKHGVSEIILHVGTNNTYDSPEKIAAKITSLCETLPTTSVTISSIIHRKNQSVSQRKKVDDSNDLLKSIAKRNNWGFIDNGNINSDHLVSDGVYLNSRGVGLF